MIMDKRVQTVAIHYYDVHRFRKDDFPESVRLSSPHNGLPSCYHVSGICTLLIHRNNSTQLSELLWKFKDWKSKTGLIGIHFTARCDTDVHPWIVTYLPYIIPSHCVYFWTRVRMFFFFFCCFFTDILFFLLPFYQLFFLFWRRRISGLFGTFLRLRVLNLNFTIFTRFCDFYINVINYQVTLFIDGYSYDTIE